ncbi:hypothetical protein SFRURICE_004766 [Spodoptera frugiperda]|uniref:SFRICE_014870 n=1 Tax=Spodoptera frugiperda TaxID=7108 RepID=A0A2H1V1Y1_SPOFR|nr:hypothetical protein SFRURICE_004766 [Spodoptera frugiperda]
MELHMHLSVAFRALDRKWGEPVDLDTSEDLTTSLPAVVDLPTTTFSSEEFLRARRIQKSCLKEKEQRLESADDTFADISSARIPSVFNESCVEEFSGCSEESSGCPEESSGCSYLSSGCTEESSCYPEESTTYTEETSSSLVTEFDTELIRSVEIHFQKCEADCTAILESGLERDTWWNVFRLVKDRAKFFFDKCKKNSERFSRL